MAGQRLTPDDIRDLVAKAFVLEAITDKPGCTSRYEDLPGKPLQDFLLAGINSSRFFAQLASDLEIDPHVAIFRHNLAALRLSNFHKSNKYINFGLLEILFPVVYARLTTNDPSRLIETLLARLKQTSHEDVLFLLETRKLAWSTSKTSAKLAFLPGQYAKAASVWEFYAVFHKNYSPDSSNFQWADQFKKGLPVLQAFFTTYRNSGEIIKTTKQVFVEQRNKNPELAIGILADMCAAAIFLWLSFNDTAVR